MYKSLSFVSEPLSNDVSQIEVCVGVFVFLTLGLLLELRDELVLEAQPRLIPNLILLRSVPSIPIATRTTFILESQMRTYLQLLQLLRPFRRWEIPQVPVFLNHMQFELRAAPEDDVPLLQASAIRAHEMGELVVDLELPVVPVVNIGLQLLADEAAEVGHVDVFANGGLVIEFSVAELEDIRRY